MMQRVYDWKTGRNTTLMLTTIEGLKGTYHHQTKGEVFITYLERGKKIHALYLTNERIKTISDWEEALFIK